MSDDDDDDRQDDDDHDYGMFVEGVAGTYDEILVPALFDPWASEVTARLGEASGTVLDVACGTGVLAQHLIDAGWMHVIGVDLSPWMLERAIERTPEAEWIEGDLCALPLDDGAADALAASFGLMFITEPGEALAEMARVTRRGGPMVISTWGYLEDSPGMYCIAEALESVAGLSGSKALRRAFTMGDLDDLAEHADDVGLADVRVSVHTIDVLFDSLSDIAEVYSTALGLGDPSEAEALEEVLTTTMKPWMQGDTVEFPLSGIILEATGRGN